jgi:hypothetical protein
MSISYRYKRVNKIRIGDGILLEGGGVLWVGRIELNEADKTKLVFIDGKNDEAVMLDINETIRLSKEHHSL